MKQMIRIVTDSSCDLSRRLLERLKIAVVPLIVRFGPDTYNDGELPVEEFWEKAAGPHPPQTSQPSVGAFEELFGRLIAQGKQVLCLTVTGKHSGTFNSARLAAQHFGASVTVFDSLSLSLGLGHQALAAAQAVQAGHPMPEILALLEDLRARTRLWIIFDTLEYIRRGGRADAFVAVAHRMTRALNIKDATVFARNERVADPSRCQVIHTSRKQAIQEAGGVRTIQPKTTHVRHVEQRSTAARRQMLLRNRLILHGHGPAGEIHHPASMIDVPSVQRRLSQGSGHRNSFHPSAGRPRGFKSAHDDN